MRATFFYFTVLFVFAANATPSLNCEYRKQGRKASRLTLPLAGEYVARPDDGRAGLEGIVSIRTDGVVNVIVFAGNPRNESALIRYDLMVPVRSAAKLVLSVSQGKNREKDVETLRFDESLPLFPLIPERLARVTGLQCRIQI